MSPLNTPTRGKKKQVLEYLTVQNPQNELIKNWRAISQEAQKINKRKPRRKWGQETTPDSKY